MSLKQAIVVVNEYTVMGPDGKGSRGSSPRDYVTGYMARHGATEGLTPIRLRDVDDYVTRYMARAEATESAATVDELKDRIRDTQKYGGVCFGDGDVSLSDERMEAMADEMQSAFESGKTVMKTVLSFSPEYLKEMGVVDPDFECRRPGDYRGHIDQMKLRMAVMDGLSKMSAQFDDLSYVGCIQVDTNHVHVHLCMVDRGRGTLAPDGTQRGRITKTMKEQLRRGIDMSLDSTRQVQRMASNVEMDRRNATCFVKRFTHEAMERNGAPQFLLSCLPEDEGKWKARSHATEMRKPNAVVREYVSRILEQPDSGYAEALRSVDAYARRRQEREGLDDETYRKLYKVGSEAIVDDCVNAVYATLRSIPREERTVRTPMLDAMGMDYEAMAARAGTDPMVEFGFRLRSYSGRLDFHKKEARKYRDAVGRYEGQEVSESARPVLEFFRFEEKYNSMCMAKYQHFLSFLPPDDEFEEEFEDLVRRRRRISAMRKLREDKSARAMKPENAEAYGRKVYDLSGGRYVRSNPAILAHRQMTMEAELEEAKERFRDELAERGLSLEESDGSMAVSRRNRYDFDEVKALDLHHLNYDFLHDIPVSRVNIERFVAAAEERHRLYTEAVAYLESSGQGHMIDELPGRDVLLMKEMADRVSETGRLDVRASDGGTGGRRARTVRLDKDYASDLDLAVRLSIEAARQADRG